MSAAAVRTRARLPPAEAHTPIPKANTSRLYSTIGNTSGARVGAPNANNSLTIWEV